MGDDDWKRTERALGLFLNGDADLGTDRQGVAVHDDSFVLLVNAHFEPVGFRIPDDLGARWQVELASYQVDGGDEVVAGHELVLPDRSSVLLRRM